MKSFMVLVAVLVITCPVFMVSGIASAGEIVITPDQWNSSAFPATPGKWKHVGTSGDTGEPAPEDQVKKAAPAKETEKAAAAGKEKVEKGTKDTNATKETKEAPSADKTGEAASAKEAAEVSQEAKAPEYRIFNLNLPAPAPAPAPAPGYIEKSGMVIPGGIQTTPEAPGRAVTVTPEK